MGPDEHRMLRALEFVTAIASNIASGAGRVGERIKLRGVGELVNTENAVVRCQPVVNAHGELVEVVWIGARVDMILPAAAVRAGVEREQTGALRTDTRLRNPVA